MHPRRRATFLVAIASLLAVTALAAPKTPSIGAGSDKVYYTAKGRKYHRQDCSTLRRSKSVLETTRADAEKKGLDACKVCKPLDRASNNGNRPKGRDAGAEGRRREY